MMAACLLAGLLSAQSLSTVPSNPRRRYVGSGPGYERLEAPLCGETVKFVDKDSGLPQKVLEGIASNIGKTLRWKVVICDDKSFATNNFGGSKGLVIYFDGASDAPTILAAPENGWAAIGVKALRNGGKTEEAFLSRVRKEAWRGVAYALGVGHESVPSVLRPIYKPSDLEAMDDEMPSPYSLSVISECAALRDIGQVRIVSYRQACREGWAPAPTNDVQRVFYEQAKADKERGPTNPIKIPMPKRK